MYRSYVEGDFTEEAKQQLIEANEEVLIQRQTDHVRISGVVFTRDIIYNRPYYMVIEDYCTDDRPGIQGHKGTCKVQVS